MKGAETTQSDDLIRGKCFMHGTPLNVLYDSSATHSFISDSCVKQLDLPTSLMKCDILVSTPTNSPITANHICLNCPLHIDGQVFLVNFICLPLFEIDISLGMNWLSINHVLIDCQKRTLILNPPNDNEVEGRNLDDSEISIVSVTKKDVIQMFMILASENNKDNPSLDKLPVVCCFPNIFPDDILGLPPIREIEFSIDLMPDTGPIFMAPYRMSPIKLVELKKQLEELLSK
ncbi:uncharacterized protein LOC113859452 [Abrus precatorius]|uniref:Uncharacterized protein LOC113859452 n=1 Tax=Abrus precatorius TaxID=3816 RepID=A0A8B8KVX7_ABRPR|nr:uncharacterized protein LOC113859452 [Abrus precatorius]